MRWALTPRRRGFDGPDLAAFWASYLRQPADPGLWYGSSEGPRRHWHPKMGDHSTICGPDEPIPADVPGSLWLFQNFAPERYVRPVMWGHWRQWLWGLMVRGEGRVRLALGPSGGGEGNPAWDFQCPTTRWTARTRWRRPWRWAGAPQDLLARCSAWAGAGPLAPAPRLSLPAPRPPPPSRRIGSDTAPHRARRG